MTLSRTSRRRAALRASRTRKRNAPLKEVRKEEKDAAHSMRRRNVALKRKRTWRIR